MASDNERMRRRLVPDALEWIVDSKSVYVNVPRTDVQASVRSRARNCVSLATL